MVVPVGFNPICFDHPYLNESLVKLFLQENNVTKVTTEHIGMTDDYGLNIHVFLRQPGFSSAGD